MRDVGEWERQFSSGHRTSPTGRVPQWVLDDAAGRTAPADPWRGWSPAAPPARHARRQRHWAGAGRFLLVVAVVTLGAVAVHFGVLPAGGGNLATGGTAQLGMPHPSPGVESSDAPLGTPIGVPPGGGTYDFLALQADGVTPVAYDPCRPIHFVTRRDNAPFGGDQLVQDAAARISEVTGLAFVYDGVTDEDPSDHREPFQPDRYGDRWAPVLVTWDTVAEQADFAADVAGLGGSMAVSVGDGPRVYVTGAIELDAVQFAQILAHPDGEADARAIVLHELGHLVGLAHVSDRTQLMYPMQDGVFDYAGGDRAGLAQLGSGACVPSV